MVKFVKLVIGIGRGTKIIRLDRVKEQPTAADYESADHCDDLESLVFIFVLQAASAVFKHESLSKIIAANLTCSFRFTDLSSSSDNWIPWYKILSKKV